jgi:serine/threonine protein kinase
MKEALDRLESLFAAALQRPAAERAAYLDQACADDPGLRQRAEALLRAQEAAGSFLSPAPGPNPAGTINEPIAERPGTVIGAYKLMEQIGEGGMGLVFVAEQQQPVRRKVALKVIKPGMDSRQVVARFEAERQALALMDHPHIAQVHDGGTTPTGRPYFVMELVKGVPITEYCDQSQVPIRQRLELFLSVCQAVQHAHQKGIIHRDLKPSNVLVMSQDGTPLVKVIDFGVAKAIGQQLTDKTLYTHFAQLIGTPLYMSPEQAGMSGLDVDTRSDIYSLGVLLYELLTGTTPFAKERLKEVGLDELRRIIREEEPPRPSTRISTLGQAASTASTNRQSDPKQLSRLFRGELDWIVMKALEKDRNRRYETASAFAADIERYLHDEPVLACPPSLSYRLRKLVRRNKGPVLAATLIVLALVGGTIGATLGMLHAEEARADEVEQRQLADAAAVAEKQAKRAAQEREAEAKASARIARVAAENEKKAKLLAQRREAQTKAMVNFVLDKVIGAARPEGQEGGLGREVTLHKALEAALPFVAESFATEPVIEAPLRMTLGLSFYRLGDAKAAAEQHQAALALYMHHFGPEHADTLASMSNLATSFGALGRYTEALKLCEETLTIRKRKFGLDHPDTLKSMANLANCYVLLDRHADALKLQEETLALQKAKLGPDHPSTLVTMNNLASTYQAVGRNGDALRIFEQTLALQQVKPGPEHPDTLLSMHNLASCYHALGRHTEALQLYEKTLALRKVKLGPGHPETLSSMYSLAGVYATLERHADAVKLLEETLALAQAKLGTDHPDTLGTMRTMREVARSYAELGRHAEALKLREETLALRKARLGLNHPDTLASMNELAASFFAFGRYADALKLWEQALPLEKGTLGPDHPDTLINMTNLASVYAQLGKHADALKLRQETLARQKARLGPSHRLTLMSMHNLALSYRDLGRHADALKVLDETLALQKATLGPDHLDTLYTMYSLGNTYADLDRHADALKVRQETLALRQAKLGRNHPKTLLTMSAVAESLVKLDRGAEALPIIDECIQRAAGQVVHPELLSHVMHLRLEHFAKMKDAAGCRQSAERWEKLQRTDAQGLYHAGCMRAVTAAVCRQDPKISKADAPRLGKEEADRAMVWLKQAVAAGFKDAAHMVQDTDLDSLRDREDFRMLLTELKAKTTP